MNIIVTKPTTEKGTCLLFSDIPLHQNEEVKSVLKRLKSRPAVFDSSVDTLGVELWTSNQDLINADLAELQATFPEAQITYND